MCESQNVLTTVTKEALRFVFDLVLTLIPLI